jgi:hypothetical protein
MSIVPFGNGNLVTRLRFRRIIDFAPFEYSGASNSEKQERSKSAGFAT